MVFPRLGALQLLETHAEGLPAEQLQPSLLSMP